MTTPAAPLSATELRHVAIENDLTRQFFANHKMEAREVEARMTADKIARLLATISALQADRERLRAVLYDVACDAKVVMSEAQQESTRAALQGQEPL